VQTADREEFESEIGRLCAGYEKPVTKHRLDAYWSGLGKMPLAWLTRCIDHALGEHGPDDLPGAKGIWKIFHQIRGGQLFEQQGRQTAADPDHLEYFANRLLLKHVMSRGGLGSTSRFIPGYGLVDCVASPELEACLKAKRALIDWFVGPIREGDMDATPAEFLRQWIAALQEIGQVDAALNTHWCKQIARPEYSQPFPPSMGRERQQSLVPA
jgi:hypothetical protein